MYHPCHFFPTKLLGALTCGPWNYAVSHIIRNDTDVRIIENQSRSPQFSQSTSHPRLPNGRMHPAARKAKPVRMQIFVRFAFCHPLGPARPDRESTRRLVQESVTARLRSDAQVMLVVCDSREIIPVNVSPRGYINQWLTENMNPHLPTSFYAWVNSRGLLRKFILPQKSNRQSACVTRWTFHVHLTEILLQSIYCHYLCNCMD